jgi:hypothetical protein
MALFESPLPPRYIFSYAAATLLPFYFMGGVVLAWPRGFFSSRSPVVRAAARYFPRAPAPSAPHAHC